MSDQFADNPFFAGMNEIRSSWGWFLTLGIALVLLGAACIVYNTAATAATILVFGWLLVVSGVFALIQAFRVHNWSGFFLYFLSALLRGFTGYLLIRYPEVGAASLTLIVAAFFVVGGLFRATGSAMLRFPSWGWAAFSGFLAFILGIVLLVQWPTASIWFIGLLIGIDMVFDGSSFVAFSMAMHSLPKFTEYKPRHA